MYVSTQCSGGCGWVWYWPSDLFTPLSVYPPSAPVVLTEKVHIRKKVWITASFKWKPNKGRLHGQHDTVCTTVWGSLQVLRRRPVVTHDWCWSRPLLRITRWWHWPFIEVLENQLFDWPTGSGKNYDTKCYLISAVDMHGAIDRKSHVIQYGVAVNLTRGNASVFMFANLKPGVCCMMRFFLARACECLLWTCGVDLVRKEYFAYDASTWCPKWNLIKQL